MRFCGNCGAQLSTALAPPPSNGRADDAQRRHITVMFCDIVDSTPLAESLDPEDFREVLTDYQRSCARAIERFNGYAAQWQGDGVVAYFGYPRAHEDDAQRAVHASVQILDELVALNRRLRELFGVSVQVRVGLHSGLVVAGEMGAGATREPLGIAGETPHIAARLQSLAAPGSVVLTDATRALLGERFHTEPLGMKTLKGISRPIAVHRIARPARGVRRADAVDARADTQLIDRVASLRELTEAWQRASAGSGTIVHITGEAGIGKSRLVRALREHVAEQAAAVRTLRCSPHHASTALYPAIRFLEELIGLGAARSAEDQLAAIERSVAAARLEDPRAAVPLLADLLAIPGAQTSRGMPPRDARNATLHILEAMLVRNAACHPLMFILEDLHWADPTTLVLLERIAAQIEDIPVACVFTFRGDFEPPWTPWQRVSKIEVGPLAPEDVRAMAAAASSGALGADALRRVEAAADGVPLFVEEMVKALPAGAQGEHPERGRGDTMVPATLRGLLAERLDRLPELTGVIDLAAVLGREFERDLLHALSPREDPGFQSSLPQLEAEDVLRPVEGSPSRLEFKHALLQEAAYDRLLRRRRRDLHEQVAKLLAQGGAPARESEPERIAHHWSCARRPAEALPYWERAGRRALKRAAFVEAAEHFRRGLEALDEARPGADGDLERGELLTQRAAALQAGQTPAADVHEIYGDARSAWERAGRPERLVPVIRGQFLFHLARAQYAEALPLAQEILAIATASARPVWLAEGHFDLGFVRMLRGQLDRARADLEAAVRCYQAPERSDQMYESHSDPGVGALAYLASMLWNQGHAQQALDTSDRSLELAPRVGGPVVLAQAWGMRCGLLLVQGKWAEFSRWLQKARTHCVERNIGYWSTVCSLWSAWLQGHAGELKTGIAVLEKHLDAYVGSAGRVGLPHFQALLADLHLLAADRRQALAALRIGQEHIEATGERYYEPELQWLMARALIAKPEPDPAGAAAAYERAARAADAQDAKLLQLRALTGLAKLQRRTGAHCTALAQVQSLCRWFGPESEVPDVVRARAVVADTAMLG